MCALEANVGHVGGIGGDESGFHAPSREVDGTRHDDFVVTVGPLQRTLHGAAVEFAGAVVVRHAARKERVGVGEVLPDGGFVYAGDLDADVGIGAIFEHLKGDGVGGGIAAGDLLVAVIDGGE